MTKAAVAKRWALQYLANGAKSSSATGPTTGLLFPANTLAGSDIRIVWSGANLLSRTLHTAIWRANYFQQTGYYAVAWHSPNTGSWDSGDYSYGTHPYPAADGTVNANGDALTGSGSSGTVHFWEIAGLRDNTTAHDFLCSPGGAGGTNISSVLGTEIVQARTCEVVSGTTLRHKFYPDVLNSPSLVIQQDIALSSIGSPSAPAFYFGASDWRDGQGGGGAGTNDETPGCTLRGLQLFSDALGISDITSEATSGANTPVTAAGLASVHYMNQNPTPTDISDKSGAGHNPTWPNANRPSLWTP